MKLEHQVGRTLLAAFTLAASVACEFTPSPIKPMPLVERNARQSTLLATSKHLELYAYCPPVRASALKALEGLAETKPNENFITTSLGLSKGLAQVIEAAPLESGSLTIIEQEMDDLEEGLYLIQGQLDSNGLPVESIQAEFTCKD